MKMMEYRPWEKNEANSIISSVSNGELPILDIQLGGGCSNHCIYCDTPKYGEPCLVNLDAVYKLINQGNIRGVYICGLGEPTSKENIKHLKAILRMCKEKGIWLAMFTNLMDLDDELLDYIDNGTLNILFKYDTRLESLASKLYGVSSMNRLRTYFDNIKKLEKVIHINNGVTNIGASIVPTSLNYDELRFEIIDECLKKGFFPLIGQLENAGNCSTEYEKLSLNEEKLNVIKKILLDNHGINYEMPICPATISGIHITNRNKVILDKRTGLSCPWFWLDEPQIEAIGDINDMNYDEIVKKIIEYRSSKYEDVCRMRDNIELYPFGGCGGNVKTLLETYTEIYQPENK